MKPFILKAAVTYATGVLAGFQIEPVLAESVDTGSFDFWDIARNNMTVVAINISGGLSMDVISILSTVYNGVILGYSVSIMVETLFCRANCKALSAIFNRVYRDHPVIRIRSVSGVFYI
jgi:hypothetical protein